MLIIIMAIYANYSVSFNEFNVDTLEDIDLNLLEEIVLNSSNILSFGIYVKNGKKFKYSYYMQIGYEYIDPKSYITYDGDCNYSYHGLNIKPE